EPPTAAPAAASVGLAPARRADGGGERGVLHLRAGGRPPGGPGGQGPAAPAAGPSDDGPDLASQPRVGPRSPAAGGAGVADGAGRRPVDGRPAGGTRRRGPALEGVGGPSYSAGGRGGAARRRPGRRGASPDRRGGAAGGGGPGKPGGG